MTNNWFWSRSKQAQQAHDPEKWHRTSLTPIFQGSHGMCMLFSAQLTKMPQKGNACDQRKGRHQQRPIPALSLHTDYICMCSTVSTTPHARTRDAPDIISPFRVAKPHQPAYRVHKLQHSLLRTWMAIPRRPTTDDRRPMTMACLGSDMSGSPLRDAMGQKCACHIQATTPSFKRIKCKILTLRATLELQRRQDIAKPVVRESRGWPHVQSTSHCSFYQTAFIPPRAPSTEWPSLPSKQPSSSRRPRL